MKTISRRSVLQGLAATAPALGVLLGGMTETGPGAAPPLRPATAGGRYFGAAVRFDAVAAEPALRSALLRDCGSVTPEIHMKWDALQPRRSDWNTGPADDLVAFAGHNDLRVRGHTLLWDQSTPTWARREIAGRKDWATVADYMGSVLGRYRDVEEWDVVNEPIDPGHRPDGLRENLFLQAYGASYVADALIEARGHAPTARLMINDYGFDYDNPVEAARRRAFVDLAAGLLARGIPLDGVGVQAHLDLSKGPLRETILRPFFAELADLGLSIAITELDVKEQDRSLPLDERDRRVADETRRYLDIALDQPAVTSVTTWGLSDRHSWLQPADARGDALNRGLPYDAGLAPKPMHEVIRSALRG